MPAPLPALRRATIAAALLAALPPLASAAEAPWFPSEWGADDQRGATA